MDLTRLYSTVSILIAFATFVPYFYELWKGTAKPHVFSWITWGVLTGLGFVLSRNGGGGEGAWVFAAMSIDCFFVAAVAIVRGKMEITRSDRVTFVAAMIATAFYAFTRDATASVILAAAIDTAGFFPTFRKSYAKPFEEPLASYAIAMWSYVFSILALGDRTFVTVLYPAVLIATNAAFVTFLLSRRHFFSSST
ncbi:hypothetical protein EBS80_00710 [bacterium]|nr:hypothetical protein [bacterium]